MAQAVAAVAAVASFVSQKKAASQAKKASKLQAAASAKQARADEIAQARERRRALAEARQRAASARQAAANQGAESSSAAQGGQASVLTQGFANVNYLDRVGTLTKESNQLLIQSSVAQGKSYAAQGQASMFQSIGSFAGGSGGQYVQEQVSSIFD